jgi:hypothetical protein
MSNTRTAGRDILQRSHNWHDVLLASRDYRKQQGELPQIEIDQLADAGWKFFGVAAMPLLSLPGCAGSQIANRQEFTQHMQNSFVGKKVDDIVSTPGPPTSSFKMTSGETAYQWQIAKVSAENNGSWGPGIDLFCKVNAVASPAGIVTNLKTEDASSSFSGASLCATKLRMSQSDEMATAAPAAPTGQP